MTSTTNGTFRRILLVVLAAIFGCGPLGNPFEPSAERSGVAAGAPGALNIVVCFGGPADSLAAVVAGLPWCGR